METNESIGQSRSRNLGRPLVRCIRRKLAPFAFVVFSLMQLGCANQTDAAVCTEAPFFAYTIDIQWPDSIIESQSLASTTQILDLGPAFPRLALSCSTETVTEIGLSEGLLATSLRCYEGGALLQFETRDGGIPVHAGVELQSFDAGIYDASTALLWLEKEACSTEMYAVVSPQEFQYAGVY